MTKVVYNGDYGGYCIPEEVAVKYNQIEGTTFESIWEMADVVPRHDKLLVRLVEEFISTNPDTDLRITEVKGNRYRIDEYDGWESVVEPEDQDWIVIDDKGSEQAT